MLLIGNHSYNFNSFQIQSVSRKATSIYHIYIYSGPFSNLSLLAFPLVQTCHQVSILHLYCLLALVLALLCFLGIFICLFVFLFEPYLVVTPGSSSQKSFQAVSECKLSHPPISPCPQFSFEMLITPRLQGCPPHPDGWRSRE